ncbi:MAG: DUF2341 domain-containing protein [Candidatus Absconditabacteria bacterium]
MAKSIRKFLKSFTLIELIIVIAIIAVLGATAFLALNNWLLKGQDARKLKDLSVIKSSLSIYYSENSTYPVPGDYIQITDEKGKLIGLQGYFDESVLGKINSINKIIKDPTSKNYYAYTTYLSNKGFELATFFNYEKLISTISNIVYSSVNEFPYVMTYGNLGYCDDNNNLKLPKPLTLYNKTNNEFLSKKNMGNYGKVGLSLKYLRAENGCNGNIESTVVNIVSDDDKIQVKQAYKGEVINNDDDLNGLLKEICDNEGLCNGPDIYKISYNYILLVYRLSNGEIYVVEIYLDEQDGKYKKQGNKIQVFNGAGLEVNKGRVYTVFTQGVNKSYTIYYHGGDGNIHYYRKQIGSSNSNYNSGIIIEKTGTNGYNRGNFLMENGESGVVGIFNNYQGSTIKSTSAFFIPFSNSSNLEPQLTGSVFVQELPFICNLPKIIYLEKDVYSIIYIGADGKLILKKIIYNKQSNRFDSQDDGQAGENYDFSDFDYLQVWENVFLLVAKDSEGNLIAYSFDNSDSQMILKDTVSIDSNSIGDFGVYNLGGGNVTLKYTKSNLSIIKDLYVNADGKITIKSTNEIQCPDAVYHLYSPEKSVAMCGGDELKTFELDKGLTLFVDPKETDSIPLCGDSNGQSFGLKPIEGLCSVGTPTEVSDDGQNFIWSCNSLNSGLTDQCSATKCKNKFCDVDERDYYKMVTFNFNNVTKNYKDYVLSYEFDTNELIDNGMMKSDCQDIKLFDFDESTALPRYIVNCNSVKTRVYTKVNISAGNNSKRIYMYYGNPNDLTSKNNYNTFPSYSGNPEKSINPDNWDFSVLGGDGLSLYNTGTDKIDLTCYGNTDGGGEWALSTLKSSFTGDFVFETYFDRDENYASFGNGRHIYINYGSINPFNWTNKNVTFYGHSSPSLSLVDNGLVSVKRSGNNWETKYLSSNGVETIDSYSSTVNDKPIQLGVGCGDWGGTFVSYFGDSWRYEFDSNLSYNTLISTEGACGAANELFYEELPLSNLCSKGLSGSLVLNNDKYSRVCNGIDTDQFAQCSARKTCNGYPCTLNGWKYSKDLVLNFSSIEDINDYVVKVILDTQSLIADGKVKSNCSDIQVYDNITNKILSRHIKNCNSTDTTLYFKTNLNSSTNDKTYKLFYGMPEFSGTANGFDVFDSSTKKDIAIMTGDWVGSVYKNAETKITDESVRIRCNGDTNGSSDAAYALYNIGLTGDFVAEFDYERDTAYTASWGNGRHFFVTYNRGGSNAFNYLQWTNTTVKLLGLTQSISGQHSGHLIIDKVGNNTNSNYYSGINLLLSGANTTTLDGQKITFYNQCGDWGSHFAIFIKDFYWYKHYQNINYSYLLNTNESIY